MNIKQVWDGIMKLELWRYRAKIRSYDNSRRVDECDAGADWLESQMVKLTNVFHSVLRYMRIMIDYSLYFYKKTSPD
mgnify:FL=1